MRALALEEYESLTTSMLHQLNTTFPSLLVPTSPTASLSALIELKSGVGGSESSLFVADLLRMYLRFANGMKWKAQVVSSNELDGGGIKDAIVEIDGKGSYDSLRWETGIHRVQRVPATEASGRVHTSTVAVLVSSCSLSRVSSHLQPMVRSCHFPKKPTTNGTTSFSPWTTLRSK
jgi:peptide chain release factor 1